MLDPSKCYAAMHSIAYGDKVRQVYSKVFYREDESSFYITGHYKSKKLSGETYVTLSTVLAGHGQSIFTNIQILHEWTKQDDERFIEDKHSLEMDIAFDSNEDYQTSLI